MKLDMPKAVFCGLALIAAAIYFGPGSVPVGAYGHDKVHKIAICTENGSKCANGDFTGSLRTGNR